MTKIKIASNLYEEDLYINVPNLIIEPKEKGGEVTLQQETKPCIIIDVGEGNTVMIKNTKMLFTGVDEQAKKQMNDVGGSVSQQSSVKPKPNRKGAANRRQD